MCALNKTKFKERGEVMFGEVAGGRARKGWPFC